jgi:GNAT superfamily N-acetyltransferase
MVALMQRLDAPPGWLTDLAVLELTGSSFDVHGDHVVVRTPGNPGYHWGNFVLVTDRSATADADRWVNVFTEAFPRAGWLAIGLLAPPADEARWRAAGLDVEVDAVLTTGTLPRLAPLADGYAVRQLSGADWDASLARAVAENDGSGREDPASYREFASKRVAARRELSDRALAAFFGAFQGDRLVAELGIVRCGATARFQDVGTDAEHRRRGLASHLLGVAATWAGDRGCRQWVIVTEATNPAGRVYRAAGFVPDIGSANVHRRTR